jgi:hypothetical protein
LKLLFCSGALCAPSAGRRYGFPEIGKVTRRFFQGLEEPEANFSEPWKKRRDFFQASEKCARFFQASEKNRRPNLRDGIIESRTMN